MEDFASLEVKDFSGLGCRLRLVWASGGLANGLWRQTEVWGEKEYTDVDCAFGLIAAGAARELTFNHRAADEEMPGMSIHIEVR